VLVRYLSDDQIVKFLGEWQGVVSFQPGHPVHRAAMARVNATLHIYSPESGVRATGSLGEDLKHIDRRERVRCYLRIQGGAGCDYRHSSMEDTWLSL
jgi:hypothetical protein